MTPRVLVFDVNETNAALVAAGVAQPTVAAPDPLRLNDILEQQ